MSPDPRSDYTELKNTDVDVDAELMGWVGGLRRGRQETLVP
jgi:hypothetical protein